MWCWLIYTSFTDVFGWEDRPLCVCVTYFSSKIDQVATPTVDEISDASLKKKKVHLAYLSLAGADIHVFSSLCVPCGSSVDLQCRSVRGDRCIFITCQMQTGLTNQSIYFCLCIISTLICLKWYYMNYVLFIYNLKFIHLSSIYPCIDFVCYNLQYIAVLLNLSDWLNWPEFDILPLWYCTL